MTERWRPVVGYEGLYSVSDHGRVRGELRTVRTGIQTKSRTVQPQLLGIFPSKFGRRLVSLCNGRQRSFEVAGLVAKAFLGPPGSGKEINHIDGDPTNNHLSNIEYCTRSENLIHALDHGLNPAHGVTHHFSRFTLDDVRAIRSRFADGESRTVLAKAFGVGYDCIYKLTTGRTYRRVT